MLYLLFSLDQSSTKANSEFLEIPASMMEKMLEKVNEVGGIIDHSIRNIQKNKKKYRMELDNLLNHFDNSDNKGKNKSSCGIDGAYIVERLLGSDLLFSCALVTEGLNNRFHKETTDVSSDYEVFVYPEKHNPDNAILARALMLETEIKLAAGASYDVIYIDGSLTTALIHMYKAVNMIKEKSNSHVIDKIKASFEDFSNSYRKILLDYEAEKTWISIPKYTSRNDIGKQFHWPEIYDDRAILTMVLEPGEYTSPSLFTDQEAWHSNLPYQDSRLETLMNDIICGIKNLYFIYYKPTPWSPAIRIEMPFYIANDEERLSMLLTNIQQQCEIPAILEPYPLYAADRIAKRISPAIPAYKQIILNQLITESDQNETDVLFMLHSYRTETGYN